MLWESEYFPRELENGKGSYTDDKSGRYMSGCHLPEEFLETEEVKRMWYELNRHISTMNDIVSLKKELVSGCSAWCYSVGTRC